MEQTVRAIEWFSKKNGRLIGEEIILSFDLDHFKQIFNHVDEDDPNIYGGGYRILQKHVDLVQSYINHQIDLNKYNYMFDTYVIKT